MAKKMSKVQKDKVRILEPIVNHYNEVHGDCWEVAPIVYEDYEDDGVEVRRKNSEDKVYAHGILVSGIAGIANAYGWTWAMYPSEKGGIYFNI